MVVVIYCSMEDKPGAEHLAETFGYALVYIPTAEADPLTQHTDEDIIVVGGTSVNPFYRYYFAGGEVAPERLWDSILNPTNFPENPELWKLSQRFNFGVSPDGKWHIQTIVRENGTKVTGIAGVHREDTDHACWVFSTPVLPVVAVALPLGGLTPALAVWASGGIPIEARRAYEKLR